MKWPWSRGRGVKEKKQAAVPAAPRVQLNFSAIADEFRGLDLNDVGNWPPYPRVTALLFLFLLTLLAGWWFDWNLQLEELSAKQQQELTLKQSFLDKKKQAVNIEEYRRQLGEIDRSFGAMLKQLPNRESMESLLVDINQAGLGRGLQFDLFRPGKENIKDFYAELPIQLRMTGSYHDFGFFAGDVSRLSRIVTLSDLVLGQGPGGGLVLDAVATTYRYLDAAEMARLNPPKPQGAQK